MATKKEESKKTTTKKTKKAEEKVVEEVKEEKKDSKKDENEGKTISGLSFKGEVILVYLIGVVGFVFALMKNSPASKEIRFHYNQSATCWIINIASSVIFSILGNFIPFSGLLSYAVSVVLLVFIIMTIVKAYNGEENYKMPVISDLATTIFGETI